jgi:hypothetical protein
MIKLVGVQPLENMSLQRNPCTPRIVMFHQVLPDSHRHSESTFLVPGYALNLKLTLDAGVKNGTAEKKKQRYFSFL